MLAIIIVIATNLVIAALLAVEDCCFWKPPKVEVILLFCKTQKKKAIYTQSHALNHLYSSAVIYVSHMFSCMSCVLFLVYYCRPYPNTHCYLRTLQCLHARLQKVCHFSVKHFLCSSPRCHEKTSKFSSLPTLKLSSHSPLFYSSWSHASLLN